MAGAIAVLKFMPLHLSEADFKNLSYRDCRNHKDHYASGYSSLLDRLEHFAYDKFVSIRSLNALDIIEVERDRASNQYLKETIEKIDRFLDFSPGLIPLVRQENTMNSILVTRSDESINRRLAADYNFLFGYGTEFVTNCDRHVIDLTSLTFGFSAFLIHGLSECRELFIEQEGDNDQDLWPESSA